MFTYSPRTSRFRRRFGRPDGVHQKEGLETVHGSLKGPIPNRTFEMVIALYDSNTDKVDFQKCLLIGPPIGRHQIENLYKAKHHV